MDRDAVVSDAVRREPRTPQGRAARRDALEDRPRTLIGRRVRVELNRAKRTLQTRHRALANVVGRRLLVFWPRDAKFYRGRVAGYDSANGKHRVVYDDGDEERVNLAKQRVMWEGGADDDTRAAMNALGESRRREGKKKRGGGADGAAEAAAGRDTKRKRTTKKTPKKKAESEEEGAPISGAVEADGCKEGVGEPERTEKVGREGGGVGTFRARETAEKLNAPWKKSKPKKRITMRHAVALALRRAGDGGMSTEEIVNLVMRDRRLVIKSKSPRGSITAVLWNKSKSKGLFVSAGPSRHKLAPGVHIPDADCGVADEDAYDPLASPPAAAANEPAKDVCAMLSVIGGERVCVTLTVNRTFTPVPRVDESSRWCGLALSPGVGTWSKRKPRKPRSLSVLSAARVNRHVSRLRGVVHTIFKGPKKYSRRTVEKMRGEFRARVAQHMAGTIADADAALARGRRTTPACPCRVCDDPDNPANSVAFQCQLAVDDEDDRVRVSLIPEPPVCLQIQATLSARTRTIGAAIALQGAASIGFRVGVAWPMDGCHYPAKIIRYDPEELKHMVEYDDDGVREYLALWDEDIVPLDGATRRGVLGLHAPDLSSFTVEDAPLPRSQSDIRRYISMDQMVTTFGGRETDWVERGFAPHRKGRGRPPKHGPRPEVAYVKGPKMPRHRRCGMCHTCLHPTLKKRCEMNKGPIIPRGKNKERGYRYVQTQAYTPLSVKSVSVTANAGYQPDMNFDEFIQWGLPATDRVPDLTDGVANMSLRREVPREISAAALTFPANASHLFEAPPRNVEIEDDNLLADDVPLARFISNAEARDDEEDDDDEKDDDDDDTPLAWLLPTGDNEKPQVWDSIGNAVDETSAPYEEVDALITAGWGENKRPRLARTRGDRGRKRVYALAALNWNTRMVRALNPNIPREPEVDTEFLPEIPYYGSVPFWRVPRWAHPLWPLGGVGINYGVVNRRPMREARKLPRVWRGKDLDMIVFGRDERLEWARKTGMFLARARTALGDRRLKIDAWGGSVLDSVFGALLTQNVSDVLSSSAIMNLAAKFPGPGTYLGRHKARERSPPPGNVKTDGPNSDPFDSPPRSSVGPQPTEEPVTEEPVTEEPVTEELVTAATGAAAFMDERVSRPAFETPQPPEAEPAEPRAEEKTPAPVAIPAPPDAGPSPEPPPPPPPTPPVAEKKSKAQRIREERAALAAQALEAQDPCPRSENTYDMIDWRAVMNAPLGDVVECIRCRGMHFMQARRIQRILRRIHDERKGELSLEFLRNCTVEIARGYLLSLEGFGVKTVSCITLLSLFRADFPVDVNVGRIMARLGWVPLETEQALEELAEYAPEPAVYTFLRERLNSFGLQTLFELHYHMITLGKVFCEKRTPNCRACPLRDMCEYASSGGKHQTDPKKAQQDTIGTAAATAAAAAAAAAGTASPPLSPMTPELANPAPPAPPSHLDVTNEILEAGDDPKAAAPETLEETLDAIMRVGGSWEKGGKPPSGAAAVLRLDPGADFLTAKAAHQRLSRVVHPDKCADPRADRAFALITAARNAMDPNFHKPFDNPDSVVKDGAYNVTVDNEIIVEETPCGVHDIEDDPTSDACMAATLSAETRGFAAHAATVAASIAASPLQLAVRPPPPNMSRIRHELKAWSLTSDLVPASLLERAPELDVGYYLAVRCGLPSATAAARIASESTGREMIPLTVMVPCRAAMNGKFPLHGTFFQTNEVFLDAETAVRPKLVAAAELETLPTVSVYLGSSVASICRGMSRAEVASSFANRAVCVRSWEPHTGHPRPLPRWACPFIPLGASLGPAPGDDETITALRPQPPTPPVNVEDDDKEQEERAKLDAIAGMDEAWDVVEDGPELAAAAAAALRAADAIDGVAAADAVDDDDDDDAAGDGAAGGEDDGDAFGSEDGAERATKVRRAASTAEWSSRVLLEYAARRRYAAETAREAAKAERRRRRREEREAARRRGGSAGREASASSAGAASTASDGSGSVAKRKASEELGVPIYRFFAPRGSSPPA